MFKYIFKNCSKYSFLPFINQFNTSDKVEELTKTEQNADRSAIQLESGWDRVKRIFQTDEFGNLSYEANSVLQVATMSVFVGAIYGGVNNSRKAYLEFMRNNEATSFKSHLDAKKKLQDAVTISFGKGAFKWGWRLTLFASTFVGLSTTIQTYRGKSGIMEYVAAGGLGGIMYKFNMGPRGWLVGGGLGSVLGLICGGTTLGILKMAGISVEDARYWQYQWKHARKEYFRKGKNEFLEKEDFALIKLHNDNVGEVGKNIENLDENETISSREKNKV